LKCGREKNDSRDGGGSTGERKYVWSMKIFSSGPFRDYSSGHSKKRSLAKERLAVEWGGGRKPELVR